MPCLLCCSLGLSTWVKLLLLFSPIHWEKLFLFQCLAVHYIWCNAVLLPRLPAQRQEFHSSYLIQTAAICYNCHCHVLFTWCLSSFLLCPSPLPLQTVCGEGGWPNSWPCGLFPELFTEFSTKLSDHCRVVADFALSQRLGLSQSLGRCWGVQKGSIRWIVLPWSSPVAQGQELLQKSTAMTCHKTQGCATPTCVEVLHLGRTRPPGSNHRREEDLPGRWGDEGQKGNSASCSLDYEHATIADERVQQIWTE